jgi:hypothetical protein
MSETAWTCWLSMLIAFRPFTYHPLNVYLSLSWSSVLKHEDRPNLKVIDVAALCACDGRNLVCDSAPRQWSEYAVIGLQLETKRWWRGALYGRILTGGMDKSYDTSITEKVHYLSRPSCADEAPTIAPFRQTLPTRSSPIPHLPPTLSLLVVAPFAPQFSTLTWPISVPSLKHYVKINYGLSANGKVVQPNCCFMTGTSVRLSNMTCELL